MDESQIRALIAKWRNEASYEFMGGARHMRSCANELEALLSAPPRCRGNDPVCPCQDGDICHYVDGADGTKAMAPPRSAEGRADEVPPSHTWGDIARPAPPSASPREAQEDRLERIIADMQEMSDGADEANGTSEYTSRLVALALLARHFLRERRPQAREEKR